MSSVLGIGNALVDILARLESDHLLEKLNFPKGSMQLVDLTASQNVLEQTIHLKKEQASGGSAANTIHGLACLGVKTGFIGKVGNDDLGEFFRTDMQRNNITPILLPGENESGRAVALISPDSERTFATYLGAAIELSANDLLEDLFKGYSYFHVEGYLVQNRELVEKALQMAKANGLTTSLDLASFNVVEENREFLQEMVEKYVDILFANEEEAKAYTGKENEEALNHMGQHADIAVLKLGKNGSLIKRFEEEVKVGIIPADRIDTTGAGDLYAAGFLYGLVNNLSLEKCGKIGTILSGNVIEVIGPKMEEARWEKIITQIEILLN
ncbi:adenosine kinase [Marinilabiliaceae bacterium JC017]|nr:adenosine kinase [Marinilabiliaceae bacterium JC017]